MPRYPIISANPSIQSHYESMRRSGQSHNMAEILATRRVPALKTDASFSAAIKQCNDPTAMSQKAVPKHYLTKARSAGVTTNGKRYFSQLASFPGDPRAWHDSRSSIASYCKRRGWGCSGAVDVAAPAKESYEVSEYRVADDLVKAEVRRVAQADPGKAATPAKRKRLLEETRARMSPAAGAL